MVLPNLYQSLDRNRKMSWIWDERWGSQECHSYYWCYVDPTSKSQPVGLSAIRKINSPYAEDLLMSDVTSNPRSVRPRHQRIPLSRAVTMSCYNPPENQVRHSSIVSPDSSDACLLGFELSADQNIQLGYQKPRREAQTLW